MENSGTRGGLIGVFDRRGILTSRTVIMLIDNLDALLLEEIDTTLSESQNVLMREPNFAFGLARHFEKRFVSNHYLNLREDDRKYRAIIVFPFLKVKLGTRLSRSEVNKPLPLKRTPQKVAKAQPSHNNKF